MKRIVPKRQADSLENILVEPASLVRPPRVSFGDSRSTATAKQSKSVSKNLDVSSGCCFKSCEFPKRDTNYKHLNIGTRKESGMAQCLTCNLREKQVSDEWIFVAMVLDRLFLIIFSVLNVGTFLILMESPSLYDTRRPMNITHATKPLGQGSFVFPTTSHL
ncbi:unnamed protein product [Gongylonema pulchrum]|uniref:G_PROTEIN_RECEP_F1_2 domain-containing protein n=1 Tax=Gongylonema pulchrum TaxID=637853 RepID=A0A183CX75_9BILA|nr:unnamed protein product [Gongylonema pulchrum]